LGGFFSPQKLGWPVWPLTMVSLGVLSRAISAVATRQRLADALLLPVSVILMSLIAAKALLWHWGGGPKWKGRTLK
jgi:chlorobactene glucosyltransferase